MSSSLSPQGMYLVTAGWVNLLSFRSKTLDRTYYLELWKNGQRNGIFPLAASLRNTYKMIRFDQKTQNTSRERIIKEDYNSKNNTNYYQ